MYHFLFYRILGWLSIAIGITATLCVFKASNLFYGIALSILGFVVSGIHIFLNQKYYSEAEQYPKGYWGMVFSSLPVLFLLFVIYRFKG